LAQPHFRFWARHASVNAALPQHLPQAVSRSKDTGGNQADLDFAVLGACKMLDYPLVNIQKTIENGHS